MAAASTSSPKMASQQQRDSSVAKDATSADAAEDSKLPTIKQPEEVDGIKDAAPPANAPLAPPPKPSQTGTAESNNNNNGADYNNAAQPNQSHLSKEPNPFENAFGNPAETPGKPTQLPGVTSLTSPASLLPTNTPGWPGSLRSGPLSPAMLTGPTNSNDYFNSDHHFSGSFPTPNESSLRTGLTPGGGGSMFPQPSPNSQALYNQLQSGGATPGTLDFHRTAMNARAHTQANNYNLPQNGTTSHPTQNPNIQPDLDSKPYNPNNANHDHHDNQDPFSSHQTNDAANGLFMLAQAGGQRNGQQAFAIPQPPQQQYHPQQQGIQQHDSDAAKRNSKNITNTMSAPSESQQHGDYSDGSVEQKPQTRATRGKKGAAQSAKNSAASNASTNGKRKSEDTPSKPVANKRQRAAAAQPSDDDMEGDDDDDDNTDLQGGNVDGRKMTDEEKRKNFLERNRVAALKCRQRKKQWLANLQQKVEIFSTENDALAATVTQLREEIVGLKTLLLAHKECPVSQAQGISSMAMQQIAGDNGQHYGNPYGMGMGGVPQGQMQGQMQRS